MRGKIISYSIKMRDNYFEKFRLNSEILGDLFFWGLDLKLIYWRLKPQVVFYILREGEGICFSSIQHLDRLASAQILP